MRCCIYFFLSYAGKKQWKILMARSVLWLNKPQLRSRGLSSLFHTRWSGSIQTLSFFLWYKGRVHFTILVLRLFRIETCSFHTFLVHTQNPSPQKAGHSRVLCSESWQLRCVLALQHRGIAPGASSSLLTLEGAPSHAAEYSYWNVMGNKQERRIIQSHPAAPTQA